MIISNGPKHDDHKTITNLQHKIKLCDVKCETTYDGVHLNDDQ